MMGMLDKKNKKEKDMVVGRLPPAGRGPSQAFGLAWASLNILRNGRVAADEMTDNPTSITLKYLQASSPVLNILIHSVSMF